MRPLPVVVLRILGEDASQVSLAEDQHLVGDLGADGQDEAFGEAVSHRASCDGPFYVLKQAERDLELHHGRQSQSDLGSTGSFHHFLPFVLVPLCGRSGWLDRPAWLERSVASPLLPCARRPVLSPIARKGRQLSMVVFGIGAHKHSHTVVAVDEAGRKLDPRHDHRRSLNAADLGRAIRHRTTVGGRGLPASVATA
jgi:hypothetical protein